MVVADTTLRLEVDDTHAHYPLTIDPSFQQQAYLKASNTGINDTFGFSVAISGDTVVVGAFNEASSTTGVNSTPDDSSPRAGAAYVFSRSAGTWTEQAYLKASNSDAQDSFGRAVAISGDTIVVGATGEDSGTTGVDSTPDESRPQAGAAYVFNRIDSTWTQQAYLKASNIRSSGDFFGYSVAISGDTVAAGAIGEDSSTTGVNSTPNESASDAGAAYVFSSSSGPCLPPPPSPPSPLVIELADLIEANGGDGSRGFVIHPISEGVNTVQLATVGRSGDIDGDGISDVLLGSYAGNGDDLSSGQSYVLYGRSADYPAEIYLSDIVSNDSSEVLTVNGEKRGDFFGSPVTNIGDTNGDGIDDFVIAAVATRFGPPPDQATLFGGICYVVYGETRGQGSSLISASRLAERGRGYSMESKRGYGMEMCRRAISPLGDVNGDGLADFAFNAFTSPEVFGNFPRPAQEFGAYVVFGQRSAPEVSTCVPGAASKSNLAEYAERRLPERVAVPTGHLEWTILKRSNVQSLSKSAFLNVAGTNGRFQVAYADVQLGTGFGFDDPAFGEVRRQLVDKVLAYIDDTLGTCNELDIEFRLSELDGTGFLAQAGPIYPADLPGFVEGYALTHLTTGIDPDPVLPDLRATIDFGHQYNSELDDPSSSETDLFTVLLHEITHGLGILATLDENGNSTVSGGNPGIHSIFTSKVATGSGFSLVNDDGLYLGNASLLISGQLVWASSLANEVLAEFPPIFAPNPFASGSSLSHWDPVVSGGAVMEPSISRGEIKRRYLSFELAALKDLGYANVSITRSDLRLAALETPENSNGLAIRMPPAIVSEPGSSAIGSGGDIDGDGKNDLVVAVISRFGPTNLVILWSDRLGANNPLELEQIISGADTESGISFDFANQSIGQVGVINDINGDGFDEIFVTTRNTIVGSLNSDLTTFVVFGGPKTDLQTIGNIPELLLDPAADGSLGTVLALEGGVSTIGSLDFNGDGLGDIVVADFLYSPNPSSVTPEGRVLVVFGRTQFPATIDLATSSNVVINGPQASDNSTPSGSCCRVGFSIANGGDLNGDMADDLVIGSLANGFVVFGSGPRIFANGFEGNP